MNENIKILYIHGFHIFGESKKKKLFEKVVGKNNLLTIKLNTKRYISLFILLFLFMTCVMSFNTYIAYRFSPTSFFVIMILFSIVVLVIIYFIGSNLALYYITKNSIRQAEQKLELHNPDIVIGIYFGAVIAMNLNYKNGKKPLILVSPSVKIFQKFTHNEKADLSLFPYVIIVNGSKDKTTTLKTCNELISTAHLGNGRVEVVDDNHSYSKIKGSDIRSWMKEVIYKPSTCVLDVARKLKDESLGHKIIINENSYSEFSALENENKETETLL
ncbi:conserved protein, unknown function [Hepatocystis sp. ex Piliocolobus tephrosceles]|nr:conserved protein, unknown function [Hepatocystis sp. ex Piliocolobus tephrosceles]VWU51684.1 conserved protein, unknown function [Hepatocystis sp. ex Piliocolobus tephrosceles]